MSDLNELVLQFQNKNEKAFEILYNMYSGSIHGVIFSVVKNKSIADELLQDTFMKAWSKSETYSSHKGRFFTWILNIARNAAIDTLRSKAYKNSKQNLNSNQLEHIVKSRSNIEESTNAIGITKFLPKLSIERREIIDLLFTKGFTQKEAALHLSIPIGTVKTRSRNSILDLRQMVL